MPSRLVLRLAAAVAAAGLASPALAQIERDRYLKYVPLTYPRLVRETKASQASKLFGDPARADYRDVSPADGIDDTRAAWLQALAVKFAPIMVRNTPLFPMDFRAFYLRPQFALHVDTWDIARDRYTFVESSRIPMGELGSRPCTAADTGAGADCRLRDLVKQSGPGRGPVEPEVAARAESESFTVMYFDFPGHDAKSWKREYWPKEGNKKRTDLAGLERTFVHPFIAEVQTDAAGGPFYELVFQYWFFYPVNDGPNDHEGDWEHINVVVSRQSGVARPLDRSALEDLLSGEQAADGSDPIVLRRIEYYAHHLVYPMDFSSPNAYLPRTEWNKQVEEVAKGNHGERWMFDRIRERAWQDAAETRINTRPVVWIGGDAIGVQSVLEMPGLKDSDGHGSYPYRGHYKRIGPGVGERVVREFDHHAYFARPDAAADYVEDYGASAKVVLLPDWERVADLVMTDPEARRAWAWLMLPIRFGFPATPSPAAGMVSHMDMGNVSPIGPAFNGGWNRIGDSSGYSLYDIARLSWASPLGVADSFFARAGVLNAPILYFMIKPPLDLIWRTLALPVRAATSNRQPTFIPANAPPERLVTIEAGVMVTPVSESFQALFLNRDQVLEIALRVALALPGDSGVVAVVPKFPTVAAPALAVGFHLGRRFSTESSLASYKATVGFDAVGSDPSKPVPIRGTFSQFDYNGNLRFNLLTGSIKPYVKYGTGITWYELNDVSVDGQRMNNASSPRFRPKGHWYTLGFSELILGAGVDFAPVKIGRAWVGGKVNYSAIHHDLGFERQAAVELSPELAMDLAGQTYSVWRHQLRVFGTVGF